MVDFALTSFYRVVVDDAVMLFDVLRTCIASSSRSHRFTVKSFLEAVSLVINAEAMSNEKELKAYSSLSDYNNNGNIDGSSNSDATNLLRDFFHSVVLQFSCEELSQVS